jgi:hypothetical protein
MPSQAAPARGMGGRKRGKTGGHYKNSCNNFDHD